MKKILFCLMLSLITLFYINSNINNTKAQSTSTTKNYNFLDKKIYDKIFFLMLTTMNIFYIN